MEKFTVWRILELMPGVMGLLGAAVGYGSMNQKVRNLEEKIKPISEFSDQIGRIDERTKSTDRKVDGVKDQVDRIVERFLPHG